MRDVILFAIVIGGCLAALGRPWIGVIMWTWISVMSPHTQAWGWMQTMPVALMVAVTTLLGFAFTHERRNPFIDPAVYWLLFFMIWICIGWPLSFFPEASQEMLTKVLKIDFMILITIAVLHTKRQIQWFVGIVTFSIGFYGVKGGIFTLMTGGVHKVWGPGGFIGGNNEVALAIILVIPFIYFGYLVIAPDRAWLRRGLLMSMGLCAAAALGSHSRGALLAIAGMSLVLWWRSDRKGAVGVLLVAVGMALLMFMPSDWNKRMHTIETYEQDASAMGRINAWEMAFHLANDRVITGGGFSIYEPSVFEKYAPNPTDIHAAHSIYFQVLGEHGWGGLFIWLAIWWYTWRGAEWVRANGRTRDDTMWCAHLAAMCQVSLIGYAVGGAFLSLAYFDLPYNVMVMVVVAKKWTEERMRSSASLVPTGVSREATA